jgi:hypothetical protein
MSLSSAASFEAAALISDPSTLMFFIAAFGVRSNIPCDEWGIDEPGGLRYSSSLAVTFAKGVGKRHHPYLSNLPA